MYKTTLDIISINCYSLCAIIVANLYNEHCNRQNDCDTQMRSIVEFAIVNQIDGSVVLLYKLGNNDVTELNIQAKLPSGDDVKHVLIDLVHKAEKLLLEKQKETQSTTILSKLTNEELKKLGIQWPDWAVCAMVNSYKHAFFSEKELKYYDSNWYGESKYKSEPIPGEWDATDWKNSVIFKEYPKLTHDELKKRNIQWPSWAKRAMVDFTGIASFYGGDIAVVDNDIMRYADGCQNKETIPGLWDKTDWKNSMILREELTLPSWCKVGNVVSMKGSSDFGMIQIIDNDEIHVYSLHGGTHLIVTPSLLEKHIRESYVLPWNAEKARNHKNEPFVVDGKDIIFSIFAIGKSGVVAVMPDGDFALFTYEELAEKAFLSDSYGRRTEPCGLLTFIKPTTKGEDK